jgi:hypothetical protein
MQLGVDPTGAMEHQHDLWNELLFNLDSTRFHKHRNYDTDPITLEDVICVVRDCLRPLGIVRGSEKQGGQDQTGLGPATWPVCFVVSVTLDGKEANVLNVWHHQALDAGDDLVLRLKPMPVRPYTLNHYYKHVVRQNWSSEYSNTHIWQLVPDKFHLENGRVLSESINLTENLKIFRGEEIPSETNWQELGWWHIGKVQIMSPAYGPTEYWHDDLANMLRTNHLDMTLQPLFQRLPGGLARRPRQPRAEARLGVSLKEYAPAPLILDSLMHVKAQSLPALASFRLIRHEKPVLARSPLVSPRLFPLQRPVDVRPLSPPLADTMPPPPALDPAGPPRKKSRRKDVISGTLLKEDGSSENVQASMLA